MAAYTPGTAPGDWRPAPPAFAPAQTPQWPAVRPFALCSGSQFRPPPPPALDSPQYAAAFNEVKDFGAVDSTVRTPQQTEVARFWEGKAGTPQVAGDRNERFVFHFTPTSCSWLNAVEGFFARLSRRRLKRGVFRSVVDLQAAINRFLAETNAEPKPFTSTADPNKIIAAVRRGHQALISIH